MLVLGAEGDTQVISGITCMQTLFAAAGPTDALQKLQTELAMLPVLQQRIESFPVTKYQAAHPQL